MEETCPSNGVWASDKLHTRYAKFLHNAFLSDVTFLIGPERRIVYGHKFILSASSWDFYNIFNLLKLDTNEITIEDVSYASFTKFLEYCYTMDVKLEENCSMDVIWAIWDTIKLAMRFHMLPLVAICEKHIASNVNTKNCMVIYKNQHIFSQYSEITMKALKIIRTIFSLLIQSENMDIFLELPLGAVRRISTSPLIQCDEMELFDALIKWARRFCEKNGIFATPNKLRLVLRDVFHTIRFPIMKSSWFIEIMANYPGMFSLIETTKICHKIAGDSVEVPGFICKPRQAVDYMIRSLPGGKSVLLFSGVPKMDRGETHETFANFNALEAVKLIGFAFVAKKGQQVNVKECQLKSPPVGWRNIATHQSARFKFNWDYDLIVVRFNEAQDIPATTNRTNRYFSSSLHCTYDLPVPNFISLGKQLGLYKIFTQENQEKVTPYLIIA